MATLLGSSSLSPRKEPFRTPANVSEKTHAFVGKGAKRKKTLGQVLVFCRKFIKDDSIQYFLQAWEPILSAWISLLYVTTLPPKVSITQLDINNAVMALNHVIAGRDMVLPSRFGLTRLLTFLDALQRQIKRDRLSGLITANSGQGDDTRAIDMYRNNIDRLLGTKTSRWQISKLKQFGRRWECLTGSYVLLLSIYSETAESYV